MEPGVRAVYIEAFTSSLSVVFFTAMVIALIAFVLTWLVPELPLRETIAAVTRDVGREAEDLFPMPTDASSVARLERSLSLIAWRDTKRDYIERVVARAGLDLNPVAAWALVRFGDNPGLTIEDLRQMSGIDGTHIGAAAHDLHSRGLIEDCAADPSRAFTPGTPAGFRATDAGCGVLDTLNHARREFLTETLSDWGPEKRTEISAAIARLSRRLVPDPMRRPPLS
jgi:DNA-binding MarR family transcriptional regulator